MLGKLRGQARLPSSRDQWYGGAFSGCLSGSGAEQGPSAAVLFLTWT